MQGALVIGKPQVVEFDDIVRHNLCILIENHGFMTGLRLLAHGKIVSEAGQTVAACDSQGEESPGSAERDDG